ncbi:SGNH/GDSL hydrolase family protein [Streptomyces sp. CBMA29]|uniref:SGNH/GDSL hydrolase family protein n=1 Tax=Streptomyces sp. CBMA29 TaxID=1896314 RepID=UPI001661DFF6|nr:SGNH/GDSL hydrolase family protein [Streptomyces sp. CBMA29]
MTQHSDAVPVPLLAPAPVPPPAPAPARAHAPAPSAVSAFAATYAADHPAEAADPHCLSPEESDRLLRGAPWKRFAVVGDSIAEGLGDPVPGYRTLPWADRTAEALRRVVPELTYLNLGLRGLTAGQVRADQAERAARFAPDLVAIVCGGNDLLLPGFSPEALEKELDLLFSRLAAPGRTLVAYALVNVAAAVPELRGGPLESGVAVLNQVTRTVAERYGAVVVEMYGHPAAANRDLYSADLVHASARGHAVSAAATVRALAAEFSTGSG